MQDTRPSASAADIGISTNVVKDEAVQHIGHNYNYYSSAHPVLLLILLLHVALRPVDLWSYADVTIGHKIIHLNRPIRIKRF